jgi:hypothetical protein
MSTLAVVEEVLRERRSPMVVKEIVAAAGERLPTKSRTPDTVVARDLSMDIKRRGDESIFVRTSPGKYSLKELVAASALGVTPVDGDAAAAPSAPEVAATFVPPPPPSSDFSPESVQN